jgi:hypothetical protein
MLNGIAKRNDATTRRDDCPMKSSEATRQHETGKLSLDFQSSALPTELPSQPKHNALNKTSPPVARFYSEPQMRRRT